MEYVFKSDIITEIADFGIDLMNFDKNQKRCWEAVSGYQGFIGPRLRRLRLHLGTMGGMPRHAEKYCQGQ